MGKCPGYFFAPTLHDAGQVKKHDSSYPHYPVQELTSIVAAGVWDLTKKKNVGSVICSATVFHGPAIVVAIPYVRITSNLGVEWEGRVEGEGAKTRPRCAGFTELVPKCF